MTQQAPAWLITAPKDGPSLNDLLTLACRGNDKIATLLYDLLFEGACAASRQDLKPDQIEFVRLHLELDTIVKGLDRLHRHASQPTIIKWIKKLETWEFIKADGYRHQYDLYFRKIEEAFKNPPPKEALPPRGRHAHRIKDLTLEDSNSDQDLTFDNVDLTFEPQNGKVETLILHEEMLKFKSENSKFKSRIKELESEMLKFKSSEAHERACREALEARVDALYNLLVKSGSIILNDNESEGDTNAVSTSSGGDDFSLTHHPSDNSVVSSGSTTQGDDTLNLAPSTNARPEIFAQHNIVQQSSENVASSEQHNAPINGATDESHIAILPNTASSACSVGSATHSSGTATPATLPGPVESVIGGLVKVPEVGDYKKEKNQDGVATGGLMTVDAETVGADQVGYVPSGNNDKTGINHSGNVQDDDGAVLGKVQQSVMPDETEQSCATSVDEVKIVTQAKLVPVVEAGAKLDAVGQNLNVAVPGKEKQGRNRPTKETAKKRDLLAEATPEVQAVVTEWRGIFRKTIGITKTLIEQATELVKFEPEPGEIVTCRLWMYKTDRNKWYSTHGMHLGDVVREFPKFRSLADIPTHDDKSKKRSIDRSGFSQQSLDKEFYPTKEPKNEQKEKVYAF